MQIFTLSKYYNAANYFIMSVTVTFLVVLPVTKFTLSPSQTKPQSFSQILNFHNDPKDESAESLISGG